MIYLENAIITYDFSNMGVYQAANENSFEELYNFANKIANKQICRNLDRQVDSDNKINLNSCFRFSTNGVYNDIRVNTGDSFFYNNHSNYDKYIYYKGIDVI